VFHENNGVIIAYIMFDKGDTVTVDKLNPNDYLPYGIVEVKEILRNHH